MKIPNKDKYWLADEAKAIAEADVISVWHPHLEDYEIGYVFQEDLEKAERTALATIKKASPFERFLSGWDLIVKVNADLWPDLTAAQRIALLDHEFCHTLEVEDRKGRKRLLTRGHDLEEFTDVVRRHGAWMPDIARMKNARKEYDFEQIKREGERLGQELERMK